MRIVAELGINTNGSLDTALRMVEAAAEAGADGIKVQAYDVQDFLPRHHKDWWLFEENRLQWTDLPRLQDEVVALGMEFGATPTSLNGVQFLKDLGVDWLKNGSDFLLRHDLIHAMIDTGIETWVATGMATWNEVNAIPEGAKLMACTSVYPCPDEEANLRRIYRRRVRGYSDHTTGTTAAVVACAYRAEMYECHFTLSHDMDGPDHAFSRDPAELKAIVDEVRRCEVMLGSSDFYPTASEADARAKWRVTKDTLRG